MLAIIRTLLTIFFRATVDRNFHLINRYLLPRSAWVTSKGKNQPSRRRRRILMSFASILK